MNIVKVLFLSLLTYLSLSSVTIATAEETAVSTQEITDAVGQ